MEKETTTLMEQETLLLKFSEYFEALSNVRLALLFGSIGNEQFNQHSDIDIALEGSFAPDDLLAMKRDLSVLSGREIDIIDLKKAEGIILHRIMTKGLRIKDDIELFVHYLKKALYYIEDFCPLQKMVKNAQIRSFIDG